ncbi:ATP-binding cassette domain-containing protein [Patescibacteria group bacterium]|nr:ATP-binding cassette domain-containing protein [Patescibacteria group bacterium]
MPLAIVVKQLKKVYEVEQKQPGIGGALRSLWNPKMEERVAVDDISFSIESGSCVGFIGPNGAGKTTTLKMLSGILWPTSGEATVLGHVPWKRERAFQEQFGIVLGSKNQLWWDLPAQDTFALNKEIYRLPDQAFKTRVATLAKLLQVDHKLDVPVRKLSLGERMKCELINALLHQPKVLLLDEPTIGLDVVAQQTVRDFLRTWNQEEQTTILLTSHAMADVQELCSRVLVIQDGRLRYNGSLQTLADQLNDERVMRLQFKTPADKTRLEELGNVLSSDAQQARLQLKRTDIPRVTKEVLEHFEIDDLAIEPLPIEDVIRTLFKSS